MLSSRRLHVLSSAAVTAVIALAGCGGGGQDSASSPLDEALGYLPQDAGFALIASTDTDDYADVKKIIEKFPFGGRFEDGLKQGLEQDGEVDFDKDIKPLLGNEAVIGTADNTSFVDSSRDTPFVLAIETKDSDKLRDLVKRGEEKGSSDGYDLFQSPDDETWAAVKDDVLVLSDDEQTLKDALARRGQDDRLTEDDLNPAFEGLPGDAPVRGYVNVKALLAADPSTAKARRVKWIDHLETAAFTADAAEDGVTVDFSAKTDPAGLTDDDLPIASGSDAPRLLERSDGAEVAFALRDPSHVLNFAIGVAKAVDPAGYAQFEAGKKAAGRKLGVDIDRDVIAQLTGDLSGVATIDGHFGVRAELEDAKAFERTLAKIMKGLPELTGDLTVKGGSPFYVLTASDGQTYAVGVDKGALIVADSTGLASDVASRKLVDSGGLEGAAVFRADAEKVANAALAKFAGGLQGLGGSLFTGPLGDLVESVSASPDGITGSLKLEID